MIGLLKNRVTFKKLQKVPNGRGGFSLNEIDKGQRWAAVLPMSVREMAQYMQLDKQIDTRIIMRRDPDIEQGDIIYFRKKRFTIDQIIDREDFLDYIELIAIGENYNGAE
jgi:SPP1 family predicted phage head-tail adaptor